MDETIAGANDLYRGIPCGSTNPIMQLEMDGLARLFDGDEENSIILGGSVCGRIHSIPTVKELFDGIINDAVRIIKELPNKVIAPEIKS